MDLFLILYFFFSCHKIFINNMLGLELAFSFYNFSFLKHQEHSTNAVINSLFSKTYLSWASLIKYLHLYILYVDE